MFGIQLSAAFCSCIAEALVVQSAHGESHTDVANKVSDFIGSKALGSLMVAYLSGYLLEKTSKQSLSDSHNSAAFCWMLTLPMLRKEARQDNSALF